MMAPRSGGTTEFQPTMRDLAATLWRQKWIVAALALIGVLLASLYTFTRTPVYVATVGVLVRQPLTNITSTSRPAEIDSQTEANIATSTAVATVADQAMDAPETPQELLKRVTANMVTGTQYLTISYTDDYPRSAARGAQAFGQAYLDYREERAQGAIARSEAELHAELEEVGARLVEVAARLRAQGAQSSPRLDATRNILEARYTALELQRTTLLGIDIDGGDIVDPAIAPRTATAPRPPFDIGLGLVLGLSAGAAVALARERGTAVVRVPRDAEEALRVPVIGTIPRTFGSASRLSLVRGRRRSIVAHAYRRLRTDLLERGSVGGAKVILVSGPAGGEGTTSVVANLGAALAEIGKRVIVVSADLSSDGLDRVFSATQFEGFAEAVRGLSAPSQGVRTTTVRGLGIVPRGFPPSESEPSNLLHDPRLGRVLRAWADNADIVLIDAPALLRAPESLLLVKEVDGVLLVAASGITRSNDLVLAADHVERVGTVIAAVLTRVHMPRRDRRHWRRRASRRAPRPSSRPSAPSAAAALGTVF